MTYADFSAPPDPHPPHRLRRISGVTRPLIPEMRPLIPEMRPLVPQTRPLIPETRPLIPETRRLIPETRPHEGRTE